MACHRHEVRHSGLAICRCRGCRRRVMIWKLLISFFCCCTQWQFARDAGRWTRPPTARKHFYQTLKTEEPFQSKSSPLFKIYNVWNERAARGAAASQRLCSWNYFSLTCELYSLCTTIRQQKKTTKTKKTCAAALPGIPVNVSKLRLISGMTACFSAWTGSVYYRSTPMQGRGGGELSEH